MSLWKPSLLVCILCKLFWRLRRVKKLLSLISLKPQCATDDLNPLFPAWGAEYWATRNEYLNSGILWGKLSSWQNFGGNASREYLKLWNPWITNCSLLVCGGKNNSISLYYLIQPSQSHRHWTIFGIPGTVCAAQQRDMILASSSFPTETLCYETKR